MMNAFCILFADTYQKNTNNELARIRTLASIPFGGRYRFIDFILSSLVNASVPNIGIITRNKYGSLVDHLGWGKDWDLNRKNGGLMILTPFAQMDVSDAFYKSKVEALNSIRRHIEKMLQDYVILSDANLILTIDFKDLLKKHLEKDADITIVYRGNFCKTNDDMSLKLNEDSRIEDIIYSSSNNGSSCNVALGIMIMRKDLLLTLLDRAMTYGWYDFNRELIPRNLNSLKMFGYKHMGYSAVINTVNDYYEASMELLNQSVRKELFLSDAKILTRVKDTVPTIYRSNSKVSDSLIADGCVVDGEVSNSILFRGVQVHKGACIKNSIIMQNSVVGSNSSLNYVITDKDVVISEGRVLAGDASYPFVIGKGIKT